EVLNAVLDLRLAEVRGDLPLARRLLVSRRRPFRTRRLREHLGRVLAAASLDTRDHGVRSALASVFAFRFVLRQRRAAMDPTNERDGQARLMRALDVVLLLAAPFLRGLVRNGAATGERRAGGGNPFRAALRLLMAGGPDPGTGQDVRRVLLIRL